MDPGRTGLSSEGAIEAILFHSYATLPYNPTHDVFRIPPWSRSQSALGKDIEILNRTGFRLGHDT